MTPLDNFALWLGISTWVVIIFIGIMHIISRYRKSSKGEEDGERKISD